MDGNTNAQEHCHSTFHQPLGIHRYASRVNLSQDVSGAHLDPGVRYTFFFGRNMQVLVKKTSVLSAETCTFPPTILFFQLVGATRKTKERRLLSASLLKNSASGMESKQPQI